MFCLAALLHSGRTPGLLVNNLEQACSNDESTHDAPAAPTSDKHAIGSLLILVSTKKKHGRYCQQPDT